MVKVKPVPTKELWKQLRAHGAALNISRTAPAVYSFHEKEWNRLRAELLDRESKRKVLPEATVKTRNERWRHYGAQGSLRWALSSVGAVAGLPTATTESKALARQAEQVLVQLLNSLSKRNTDS